MAFQYYGGNYFKGLDYSPVTEQPQQQQQSPMSQIDPNQLTTMIQNIMGGGSMASQAAPAGQGGASQLVGAGMAGGGSLAGMAGSAGGGGAAQLSGASLTGSGAGASGGSGAMSGVMSNPWAWLAAVVVGNELYANHRGYRRDGMDYWKDLFSGEVMHQDLEQRFLPKIGVKEGSKTSKVISHLIQPVSADLGQSWDRLKEIF